MYSELVSLCQEISKQKFKNYTKLHFVLKYLNKDKLVRPEKCGLEAL